MPASKRRRPRQRPPAPRGVLVVLILILLTGCLQTPPHVVKIGLVAPFEGRYREIGYDVIPAARLAVREWAARPESRGLGIEIVAYDDGGDPLQAIEQARRLSVDPDVVIVLGHWRDETTQAALPVYEEAGLPLVTFSPAEFRHAPGLYNLSPSSAQLEAAAGAWATREGLTALTLIDAPEDVLASVEALRALHAQGRAETLIGGPVWGLGQFYALTEGEAEGVYFVSGAAEAEDSGWPPEQLEAFIAGYEEGSLGAPPGLLSITAYQATWVAIREAAAREGIPLSGTPVDSLAFDADGCRLDPPVYLYLWRAGQRSFIEQLR